jgi:hypothetical protein
MTRILAADCLSLGAAPTFAFMAAFTAAPGGAHATLCSAGSHTGALDGMVPMYVLMSIFHFAPWWRLIILGRTRDGDRGPLSPAMQKRLTTGETYG